MASKAIINVGGGITADPMIAGEAWLAQKRLSGTELMEATIPDFGCEPPLVTTVIVSTQTAKAARHDLHRAVHFPTEIPA
jgi:hypothetical protein